MNNLFLMFDVESVGLHGQAFSVGYVVWKNGQELVWEELSCDPDASMGTQENLAWVKENCVWQARYKNPAAIRDRFWSVLQSWKALGADIVTDCGWPVEARFLADCIDDNTTARQWQGPYPLHDLASARYALGLDPLAVEPRQLAELPPHNALADARQSARLWWELRDKEHNCE